MGKIDLLCDIFTSRGHSVKRGIVIVHVRTVAVNIKFPICIRRTIVLRSYRL